MTIRNAQESDLSAIAGIHKAQFESHFLGQYSTTLLACFYRSFLGKNLSFLVHETANTVDGFVLGGESAGLGSCRMTFVRKNLLRCLGESLLRPRLWRDAAQRAIGLLHFPRRAETPADNKSQAGPKMEILSIAVSKDTMGKGVGAALIVAFEKSIQASHVEHYDLVVVKENRRASRFYEKSGFQVIEDDGLRLFLRKTLKSPGT
jgi:ribosomal protein S18 acetylase RimI-like enzyme